MSQTPSSIKADRSTGVIVEADKVVVATGSAMMDSLRLVGVLEIAHRACQQFFVLKSESETRGCAQSW